MATFTFSAMTVSSVTKEGIRELQMEIHNAAIQAKDHDTHDPIIGMQASHILYKQTNKKKKPKKPKCSD